MFKEFKEFAIKGNAIEMVIGVTLGAAFSTIVAALTEGIINPVIGFLTSGVDLSELSISLGDVVLQYGLVIDSVIKFIIVAFFLFFIVKTMNKLRETRHDEEEAALPDTKECPYCFKEVAIQASKCPYCTSDLE